MMDKTQAIASAMRAVRHNQVKDTTDVDWKNPAEAAEHIQDLQTNLRLLCDVVGVDWYECSDRSYAHYLMER